MNWLRKAARRAKRLIRDNWRSVWEWYIERERLKQIRRREELGDL